MASSSTFALDFLRRLLCAHSAGGGRGSADDDRPGAAGTAAARHACTPPETEESEPPRSPCIVARLMGLDAMPLPPEPPQVRTPPLRRSRSASSAEGSPAPGHPWDCEWETQPLPRVVRASASLRERPAYLRQESDEFLLLSFSPGDEDRDRDPERERDAREELDFLLAAAAEAEATATATRGRGGGRVRPPDAAGSKQRRGNGLCRRLRFATADDEAESQSESAGRVLGLRLRRRTTTAAECVAGAHSSSPVSVLEAMHDESSTTTTTSSSLEEVEHAAEPCSATSDEPQTILEQQDSRRKLHPDFFQLDNPSPPRSSCHVSRCSDRERSNVSRCSDREKRNVSRCSDRERRNRRVVNKDEVIMPEVSGIWQPICRLVEEDLKNMEWPARDGRNVVAEIEFDILEHLKCEMVDELLLGMSETVQHPFSVRSVSKKQLSGKNVQTRLAIGRY